MLTRRAMLLGTLFAPIIIKTPNILMPIKSIEPEVEPLPPGTYNFVIQSASLDNYDRLIFDTLIEYQGRQRHFNYIVEKG